MRREGFDFFLQIRVRYAEVDNQGIVFNAHYLTYFDTAITEYLRGIGHDYAALVAERDLDFHLVKSTVEYLAPIRSDALIEVGVAPARIGRSSITWELGIFPAGADTLLSKGEIVWVCSRVGEHKSHPVPPDLVALLGAR